MDALTAIVPVLEEEGTEGFVLRESPITLRLLYTLERIYNNGLKDIAFFGTTVVWDYFEHVQDSLPDVSSFLRKIRCLILAFSSDSPVFRPHPRCTHTHPQSGSIFGSRARSIVSSLLSQ